MLQSKTGRSITAGTVALLVVLFAVYVWPTPYKEYTPPEQFREWVMKVRVNRITGSQDFLMFGQGWQKAEGAAKDTSTAMDSALSQIRAGKK